MAQERTVEMQDLLVAEVCVVQEDRGHIWENGTDTYQRRMSVQIWQRIAIGPIAGYGPDGSPTC